MHAALHAAWLHGELKIVLQLVPADTIVTVLIAYFCIASVVTVQGESIATTTKGPTNLVCLRQHKLVRAWEPTMASGYCSGLGFPYAFLGTYSTSVH